MPKKDTGAERMPGHAARTESGRLRRIREDTHVGTLEERYGVDFGVRSDMEWGALKEKLDVDDVKEALDKAGR